MPHDSGWNCPGCQRRVPARVEECYCGVKRSQVPTARPVARGSHGVLLTGAGLMGAGALIATLSLRRAAPTSAPSAPPLPQATWAPKLAAPTTPPRREAPVDAAASANPPANRPQAPATVEPSVAPAEPEAPPEESLDDQRQRAAESFDHALEQLALRTEHFRKEVRHYQGGCQSGTGPWPPGGCDAIRQELRQSIAELRRALEDSDEQARRAAVYPGVRTEIRRRHGLDEEAWAALLRSAKETLE